MTLFPTVSSYSSEWKRNGESNYDFFSRICNSSYLPDVEDARARLELWFSRLSKEEKSRMQQGMSRGNDVLFDACFFELFVHELLRASGCKPEPHPALVGRTKAPDFVASSSTGLEFFVEATVVTDKSDTERGEEKLRGQILDMLNRLPSPCTSFAISELSLKSNQLPSLKKLEAFVREKVSGASDDTVSLQNTIWEYESDRIKLVIRPIPLNNKTWNSNVGSGPSEFRWGGPETAIERKLLEKATRYGKLEKPFVIAVNVVSKWTNSLKSVTKTLLGIPHEVLLQQDEGSAIQEHLDSDSFWYKKGVSQHRTVSAVLATRMFPQSVLRAPLILYHNPHARYPLPDDAFSVSQIASTLAMVPGRSLQEILG